MPEPRVVIVECDRCHRPIARIDPNGDLLGTVQAENDDPGGVLTVSVPGVRTGRWATSVIAADPSLTAGSSRADGRAKLRCAGSKPTSSRPKGGHPLTEVVTTPDGRRRAYEAATKAGRTRIAIREIR